MQTGNFYLLQTFDDTYTWNILLDYSTNRATAWVKDVAELEHSPDWVTISAGLPTLDKVKQTYTSYRIVPLPTPSFKCSDYPELFI